MEKKRLKKFKMAVGLCGPRVLYTNIYKAYTVEEAAKMYFEDFEEEPTPERFEEVTRRMYEVEEKKPLEAYYDSMGRTITEGDDVIAIIKIDQAHSLIGRAKITKLTKRGIKVSYKEKEYPIYPRDNDFIEVDGKEVLCFGRVIKITEDLVLDGDLAIGNKVAFMKKEYMGTSAGFLFGTVEQVGEKYIHINTGEEVVKKTPAKVQKLS